MSNEAAALSTRSVAGFLTGAAALAFLAAPASAGPAPPNFDGVWVQADSFMDKQDGTHPAAPGRMSTDGPQLQAIMRQRAKPKGDYLTKLQAAQASEAKGIPVNDPTADCLPQGMPRFWEGPYAWEFLMGAKQLNLFQEWNDQVRRVYLDGRKHPSLDDYDPSYNGHSIGHWEGDTLVVDTVHLKDTTLLATSGSGHSDALHIVERLKLTGPDLLQVTVTVNDDKALVEPWTFTRTLRRRPDMEAKEYVCTENNRNPVGADGVTQAILKPK